MAKNVTPYPVLDDKAVWRATAVDPDNPGALALFANRFVSQEAAQRFMDTGEVVAEDQLGRPAYVPSTYLVYADDFEGRTSTGQPLAGRTLAGKIVTPPMQERVVAVYGTPEAEEAIANGEVTCSVCVKRFHSLQNPSTATRSTGALSEEEKEQRAAARKEKAAAAAARIADRQATLERMRSALVS